MGKKILMIGTFDSKGPEFEFLHSEITKRGHSVFSINAGTQGTTPLFPVDIEAEEVAKAGGSDIEKLRNGKDRGDALRVMSIGAQNLVKTLYDRNEISGIIGMGGSGGTAIATAAMRKLPIGFPKICVSTLASGNTSDYIGSKDILLFPSVVDISGINKFSRTIISNAAGAICGMSETVFAATESDRPIVFISMFGNTTKCVDQCRELLDSHDYDSIIFHATGVGGRTMEELIMERYPIGVLDITTTEWADEVAGGMLSAGNTRLDAAGVVKLPHLIVPGCIDMVNFSGMDTVPDKYKKAGRKFLEWSPMVTLMRTDKEESRQIGEIFAQKANASKGPVKFLFPLKGLSVLGEEGNSFYDPEADMAFLDALKKHIKPSIEIVEIDANINDIEFSNKAVEMLLAMLQEQ